MKYVLDSLRREEAQKQIPVIRMEIDYELVTLHDALQANDKLQIIKTKERLEQLRLQLIKINKSELLST